MKKPRSQDEQKNEEAKKQKNKEAKKYKNEELQELQEPRRTPQEQLQNTSQSSIPPYSTNPSQLLPSLYNSSRTFEPIQTFYNF